MSRCERPLKLASGPEAQLAHALRELRHAAGLTYRELGTVAHYHHTVMWRAANGKKVPSWKVTIAFVLGCEHARGMAEDHDVWNARWKAAAEAQASQ